jgi:hypothetical protein
MAFAAITDSHAFRQIGRGHVLVWRRAAWARRAWSTSMIAAGCGSRCTSLGLACI